ncbi:hypothetical protein DACRYDRAFT_18708 [Dacryopinax primogenitus]|uniref:Uncharacterized protein n=1 Tax=Dacryopinax primogenitus (strain DJM 731) TaxID=1858805 RepID=M5G0G8_DACPD|nr:uncharacterized protein DACRYDRAFT_18708 [Dacryopinax primogenitus]EJT97297.1 hypothetical protein DACRYDRAFT_18708 [Dacryopinax primogenitus]
MVIKRVLSPGGRKVRIAWACRPFIIEQRSDNPEHFLPIDVIRIKVAFGISTCKDSSDSPEEFLHIEATGDRGSYNRGSRLAVWVGDIRGKSFTPAIRGERIIDRMTLVIKRIVKSMRIVGCVRRGIKHRLVCFTVSREVRRKTASTRGSRPPSQREPGGKNWAVGVRLGEAEARDGNGRGGDDGVTRDRRAACHDALKKKRPFARHAAVGVINITPEMRDMDEHYINLLILAQEHPPLLLLSPQLAMQNVIPTFNERVLAHLQAVDALTNFDSVQTLVAVAQSSTDIDQSLCDPKNAAELLNRDGHLFLTVVLAKACYAQDFLPILSIDVIQSTTANVKPRIHDPPTRHSAFLYASTPMPIINPQVQRRGTEDSMLSVTEGKGGCSISTPLSCMRDMVRSCIVSTQICAVRCGNCLDKWYRGGGQDKNAPEDDDIFDAATTIGTDGTVVGDEL